MAGPNTQQLMFDNVPDRATITEIVPAPNDPSMRRIRVAGKTVATIRDADVIALGFEAGQTFTVKRRAALAQILATNKARKMAMTAIGNRATTTGELRDRLIRRGQDATIAKRVVEQLVADHWLDDERFARDLVDEILSRKPAGRPLLLQKLEARNVPRDIAKQVVDDALDEVDPKQAALEFAKQKLSRSAQRTGPAAARRLYGLLARRGVDETIIQDVLEELGVLSGDDAMMQE